MEKDKVIIINKLVKDIQKILVYDERIPMSAAKEINNKLNSIVNLTK